MQQEGHEVGWYTGGSLAGRLAELGLTHYPFDRAIEHTAENLSVLYPERARLKVPMAIRFDAERIFVSNLTNFFEDIKDVQKRFPFDALVLDATVFIRRLVSAKLGRAVISFVPVCNMESDPMVPPMFFGFPARNAGQKALHAGARLVSEQVVLKPARLSYIRQLNEYGIQADRDVSINDEPYRWSDAVIQTGTASFDFPRQRVNPKVHYVGALLPHRADIAGAQQPDDGRADGGPVGGAPEANNYARTVVVTQGTVDNQDPGKLMIPTIEALKDQDVLVLVATGGAGTGELRRRYPQPAAGLNEGKNDVNARVEHAGVGINMKTERPTQAAICAAVDTVLGDPSWRGRALGVRDQIEADDGVGAAVGVITAAVGSAGDPQSLQGLESGPGAAPAPDDEASEAPKTA